MKTRNALDALIVGALMALLAGCAVSVRGVNAPASATPTLPQPTDTSAPDRLTFVQDPMSIPDEYDWSQGGACGSMQPGGLELTASQVCQAPDPITSFHDGTVSISAQQTSGTLLQGYALIFRAQGYPVPDFYGLLIDGNGKWRALKVINSRMSFFTPFTFNPAIHRGLHVTNTLKVVMTGSHFDLYVNDVKVGQFDDSDLATGVPGVLGGPGITVFFTYFTMEVVS